LKSWKTINNKARNIIKTYATIGKENKKIINIILTAIINNNMIIVYPFLNLTFSIVFSTLFENFDYDLSK
jgi:hypothetical protein